MSLRSVTRSVTRYVDPYILVLLCVVALAAIVPARGAAVVPVDWVTAVAIGVLFFLYGARLSTREALDGLRHWRLHLLVLIATFVVFPLLGLGISQLSGLYLPVALASGLLYLSLVPSTVQSSVAFTSLASGNVAASVCAASFSNLLGVVLTPMLAVLLMGGSGVQLSATAVERLVLQLLAPFIVGQLLQRWLGPWLRRHKRPLGYLDRVAVLLVVYSAFSAGMRAHMWSLVSVPQILVLLGICAVMLTIVLILTWFVSGLLGFDRADRISIVFAGSKKSMASGLPMAGVLFPAASVGLLVLPLMVFHQLQLVVCAQLAKHWQRQAAGEERQGPEEFGAASPAR